MASPEQLYGELRSVLHGPQSVETWSDLCHLLMYLHDSDMFDVNMCHYVSMLLEQWPNMLRVAPESWLDASHDLLLFCKVVQGWFFYVDAQDSEPDEYATVFVVHLNAHQHAVWGTTRLGHIKASYPHWLLSRYEPTQRDRYTFDLNQIEMPTPYGICNGVFTSGGLSLASLDGVHRFVFSRVSLGDFEHLGQWYW